MAQLEKDFEGHKINKESFCKNYIYTYDKWIKE